MVTIAVRLTKRSQPAATNPEIQAFVRRSSAGRTAIPDSLDTERPIDREQSAPLNNNDNAADAPAPTNTPRAIKKRVCEVTHPPPPTKVWSMDYVPTMVPL